MNYTIALGMVRLCVFFHALGPRTVVFMLEPECGHLLEDLRVFLCRFYFGGYCREYEQPINDNPMECKRRIKDYIEEAYGYNLSQTLDKI